GNLQKALPRRMPEVYGHYSIWCKCLGKLEVNALLYDFLARRDSTVALDCISMFSGLRSAELFWGSSGVPSGVKEATRLLRGLA
ncbi:12519_t:CDS:2, partial [Dentiscutata heterogama]